MNDYSKRLHQLQATIVKLNLSGFLVPSSDEFQNEYPPSYSQRLKWLTGFSGSSGTAVILKDKAAFFTDGRYTLQARKQLTIDDYLIFNIADTKPWDWVSDNLSNNETLGFDPWIHTKSNISYYDQGICHMEPVEKNLVDMIWHDKDFPAFNAIKIHPLKYSGERTSKKIKNLSSELQKRNIDASIISSPDSICWLLNIRGSDALHTPFVLAYAILYKNGTLELFVDAQRISNDIKEHLGKEVTILSPGTLEQSITKLTGKNILLDPNKQSFWIFDRAKESFIINGQDPCQLPKACKNTIEMQGCKNAHIRDGAALTKFLHWLDKNVMSESLTELSASEKLLEFRSKDSMFDGPSFDTIAGFADNGAVIHYKATAETNKALKKNGLFLVDSGGQYLDGTTDVTRTIVIGTPSAEQKYNFTLVLKGHISLATSIFPDGTTGAALDCMARQFLWRAGLDYDHGTGHGVGSYLSVHEGPQSISKHPINVALKPGMILSNEPGYYKVGEYGIRIENLVCVIEMPHLSKNGRNFYGLETLTKAPIDPALIEISLLTDEELAWLKTYHQSVLEKLSPLLNEDVNQWLEQISQFDTQSNSSNIKDYDW